MDQIVRIKVLDVATPSRNSSDRTAGYPPLLESSQPRSDPGLDGVDQRSVEIEQQRDSL